MSRQREWPSGGAWSLAALLDVNRDCAQRVDARAARLVLALLERIGWAALHLAALITLLLGLGALGGTLAGSVGIGAGIVLTPLLLYLPPLLGYPAMDMRSVTGLTMVHSLCATCVAALGHHRQGAVRWPVVRWMGSLMALSCLAGALASRRLPAADAALRGLYSVLAIASVALILVEPKCPTQGTGSVGSFSKSLTAAISLVVGFIGGLIGQTAAVITTPMLRHVVRLPLRVAIGSGLAITFCAAVGGSIGKQAAGQVKWAFVPPLVAGSITATVVAARFSQRIPIKYLRRVLAVLIAAAALKMAQEAVVLGLGEHAIVHAASPAAASPARNAKATTAQHAPVSQTP